MDKFVINGPTRLSGQINISGSKNAALPIMTACLAFPGKYTISNIPNLRDTKTMLKLLAIIGCKISHKEKSIIIYGDADGSTIIGEVSGVTNFPFVYSDAIETLQYGTIYYIRVQPKKDGEDFGPPSTMLLFSIPEESDNAEQCEISCELTDNDEPEILVSILAGLEEAAEYLILISQSEDMSNPSEVLISSSESQQLLASDYVDWGTTYYTQVVAISGDGGDELLGGYTRTALSLKNTSNINKLISNLYPIYPSFMGTGNYFLSKSNNLSSRYSSFLEDKKLLKLLKLENQNTRNNINIIKNIDPYKSLLIADYNFYLPDMMLFKIDRTSMANSLEIRSPFVDHKLIEYIFSHDTNYYSTNNSKALLKEYLQEDFGNNFVNRRKQGFVFDIENWIFSNIKEISGIIYSGKVNEIITKSTIKSLSRYKSRINSHRIWKLYVLNNYLSRLN